MHHHDDFDPKLDLRLEKIAEISPELIWKAWTTPEILMKWFCPRPWKTVECEMDLRPGGIFRTVMLSPEGQKFPNLGCFLEVLPNKRLTWTDALLPGFRPVEVPASGAGFLFTATIQLEPHARGCKYLAIVKHRNEADRKQHEEMGFEQGWSICLDQLIETVKK